MALHCLRRLHDGLSRVPLDGDLREFVPTSEQIDKAIDSAHDSCPGPDGLPFRAWKVIKTIAAPLPQRTGTLFADEARDTNTSIDVRHVDISDAPAGSRQSQRIKQRGRLNMNEDAVFDRYENATNAVISFLGLKVIFRCTCCSLYFNTQIAASLSGLLSTLSHAWNT